MKKTVIGIILAMIGLFTLISCNKDPDTESTQLTFNSRGDGTRNRKKFPTSRRIGQLQRKARLPVEKIRIFSSGSANCPDIWQNFPRLHR